MKLREHGSEQSLETPSFARAVEVRDDRDHYRKERACAKALDGAEQNQLGHVLRGARQPGAEQEKSDADHQHHLAAEDVRELAVDRHRDRRRQKVDRDDPGVEVGTVQVRDDAWQGSTDHRLVERREE